MKKYYFYPEDYLSHDEIYNKLEEVGVFQCDELESDGTHYDMSTAIDIREVPIDLYNKIIEHNREELEENENLELMVKHAETICIDENGCYYGGGSYYTYILFGHDEPVWWEEPSDFENYRIRFVKNKLKELGWLKEE